MSSSNTNSVNFSRAPSNIHPSFRNYEQGPAEVNELQHQQFQDTKSKAAVAAKEDEEDTFYSAQGTPISRPQSIIKATLQDFAGSYSRTSLLYMTDSISVDQHSHAYEEDDLESLLSRVKSIDSKRDQSQDYQTFNSKEEAKTHMLFGPPISRHSTIASEILKDDDGDADISVEGKKSNFVQSIFNAINVLVGIGILALPLSLKYAGWIGGSLIFMFCCFGTNYTAKLIIKCLKVNASNDGLNQTYGDMGQIAFGKNGRRWISIVFLVELVTIGVAMIVLFSDVLQTLFTRDLTLVETRCLSFIILLPTVFLPIRKLAYTSLTGIIACFSLLLIVFYDGISKKDKPGSLLEPMETEFIPTDISYVPLSFGLIMSGFAGHAVFPSIYRDMEDPKAYNRMVNLTYIVTAGIYVTMAVIGYLMFGKDAMEEITQNLTQIPEYSQLLNKFAIWLLVMTPVSKYGLMTQPLNLTCELWLSHKLASYYQLKTNNSMIFKIFNRITITAILVYISYLLPAFDRVMSLLGALFSFGISILFPIVCHLKLFNSKLSTVEKMLNWTIFTISLFMAIAGTLWSLFFTSPTK
ncbi:transmembrane amino acid transporter protein-domain-containing protein [Mycotypha africana]|uniref:transmembrane amino acid transporter protein-domain-containing protein n=1 Tax=Mycotypha africana TaxID=64632 RepID=UPI0023013CD6|nr:transmembrane amino acid transporter protein-domain-containing protein [Mycotypha africana]KAI8988235.1 transmembrane amino acid transporter protein-domain-containing protein [Mycotypha africana]